MFAVFTEGGKRVCNLLLVDLLATSKEIETTEESHKDGGGSFLVFGKSFCSPHVKSI